jgi:nicotinamide mononucleotide transporter
LILGGLALSTSLLCAYFASKGKRLNYILGLVNYLLMAYICLLNGLYGLFVFNAFLFSPLQAKGFVTWKKNLAKGGGTVKVREFSPRNSVAIILSCIAGSLILGLLLSRIPGQQLPFLDASSNCINLCGIILMIMRFKESWWVWLANNVIDLIIWIIVFIGSGSNSFMMLLSSIAYLAINIWGIYSWSKKARLERG